MKCNTILILTFLISSQLFGFWADSKFPEKLIGRYPSYKTKILKLNDEINYAFKMIAKDPKNKIAERHLADKSKEFADLICEAARNEIKEQITEETEFVKI